MKLSFVILTIFVALVLAQRPPSNRLNFFTISTPWNNPISMGYHEPTDRVISSATFSVERAGLSNLYTIDSSGNIAPFSTVQGLTPGEVNMYVVPPNPPPGYQSGEIFFGNNAQPGTIVRISPSGVANMNWCRIPGETDHFGFGAFTVDATGVWNNSLIASTFTGRMWIIDSGCTTFRRISTGFGSYCEGLIVIPNNVTRWGPFAGNILHGCENGMHYSFRQSTNAWTSFRTNVATDDLDLIPAGQNWFGMNWSIAQYIGCPAADWNGLEGYILSTTHNTGLQVLFYDSASNSLSYVEQSLDPNSQFRPVHLWEQSGFTSSGIAEILPPSFSLCMDVLVNGSPLAGVPQPQGLIPIRIAGTSSAVANYRYNTLNPFSASLSSGPAPVAGELQMYFVQSSANAFSLVIILDAVSGTQGGALNLSISSTGLGNPNLVVSDDPSSPSPIAGDFADTLSFSNGRGNFNWRWGPGRTDGIVLSPLSFVTVSTAFTLNIQVSGFSGSINSWRLYSRSAPNSQSLSSFSVPLSATVSINRKSCTCGNNIVDPFEQCDGSLCCLPNCQLKPLVEICRNSTIKQACNYTTECDGVISACNLYSDCTTCAADPKCGWCCEQQACVAGNFTHPPAASVCRTFQFNRCTCPTPCLNGGVCSCASCQCPGIFTGPDCGSQIGCDNQTYPAGTPLPPVDVCGVCRGNGTSCLGCDGTPFGPKLDNCGVCGGNGSSCFVVCDFATNCESCVASPGCIWCTSLQSCRLSGYRDTLECTGEPGWISDCSQNVIPQAVIIAASISAGIIAAIVIAIIVALVLAGVGGKLGYDYYNKNRNMTSGVKTNPLYEKNNTDGVNPLYEQKD